ncbi:transcriptional regulator domain-containing protein [Sphingobium fuliginis]
MLRRDPAYQIAHREFFSRPCLPAAADPAFVTRWGLHFP